MKKTIVAITLAVAAFLSIGLSPQKVAATVHLEDNNAIAIQGNELAIVSQSEGLIVIQALGPQPTEPSPSQTPSPEPSQTATPTAPSPTPSQGPVNIVLNGQFHIGEEPNFEYWEQFPDYWCNFETGGNSCGLHGNLPSSPSGTWSLQADRDYKGRDAWPEGCCPSATAWQYIYDVPNHSQLWFGWEEIHHLHSGTVRIRVYGIIDQLEVIIFEQLGPRSTVISDKNTPPSVYLDPVPIPIGGYDTYKVEVYAMLIDWRDGILIGDIKLLIQ